MLATLPALDNARTKLPLTMKTYVPKGFSVRVFKGPTVAGQPSATATFNVGHRGGFSSGEPAPNQNWYPPRTSNGSRPMPPSTQNPPTPSAQELNSNLRPTRSRFSIYQNADDTYVYEPSLSTNGDIYSNSDFDSSATSLTISPTVSSATVSTDSLVAIKSPPTVHASLGHDPRSMTPNLRSQSTFDAPGRSSSDRSLQSYSTTSGSASNNLYIRTDQNALPTPSHLLPTIDDLDSPLYPPSTVSEFEREQREALAKANAEYNATSSSSSSSSYQGTPRLAVPVPPSQRDSSNATSTSQRFFPSLPLRSSPKQEAATIQRQYVSDVRPGGSLPTPSPYRPAAETMRRNSVDHALPPTSSFAAHRSSVAFQPQGANEGSSAMSRYIPVSHTMVSQPNTLYTHPPPGAGPNGASYDTPISVVPPYAPVRNIYSDPKQPPVPVYGLNRTPSRSSPRQEIAAPVPSSIQRPPTTHVSAGAPPKTSPKGSPPMHSPSRVPSQRSSPQSPTRDRDRLSPNHPNHPSAPRPPPSQIYRPADPITGIPGGPPGLGSNAISNAGSRGTGGTGGLLPPRRLSDSDSYISHSSTAVPGAVIAIEPHSHSARSDSQRRFSDGDQIMVSGANERHMVVMHPGRSVRWNDNLICPSPILASQRRKGWFNRRGDQLWTNAGEFKPAIHGEDYPPDLSDYPEYGEGWMNEGCVRIDMHHRLIPKVPKKSALKK